MMLDILAIQYLYGANYSYHATNDTYTIDPSKPFLERFGIVEVGRLFPDFGVLTPRNSYERFTEKNQIPALPTRCFQPLAKRSRSRRAATTTNRYEILHRTFEQMGYNGYTQVDSRALPGGQSDL
jgi:hypothetical protein